MEDAKTKKIGGRDALIVLGMHRSGTSALAGTLALAGVDLGQRLVPPAPDNPKGFFEHDAIWRIHHDLLLDLGSSWHDVRPLPSGWLRSGAAFRAKQRLLVELNAEFAQERLWGVKDPRLSRTFPLWPQVLDELGATPKIILSLRDPLEVAFSLRKRDGLGWAHALALWLRYSLEAERNTRALPRTIIFYPDLLADWKGVVQKIGSVLNLKFPGPLDEQAVLDFLDPKLRNEFEGLEWANMRRPYSQWAQAAFAALRVMPDDPNRAQRELDEIWTEFEAVLNQAQSEQIDDHLKQVREQRQAIEFLESERKKLIEWANSEKSARETQQKTIATLGDKVRDQEDEITRLQAWIRNREESIAWLDTEKQRREADIERLRGRIQQGKEEISRLRAAYQERLEQTSCLQARLDKAQQDIARLENSVRGLNEALRATQQELENTYSSRSWRWTKPLRQLLWVVRMVKRKVNRVEKNQEIIKDETEDPQRQNITPVSETLARPATIQNGNIRHSVEGKANDDNETSRGRRILIVTPDIHGPIRNGGIGTAFAELALMLVDKGYKVTIAYALGGYSEDGPLERWVEHYSRWGIALFGLNEKVNENSPAVEAPIYRRDAWKVHQWLRQNQKNFDVAIFPEWMGLAYYVLLAKNQGLDYAGLKIVVNTHSPDAWAAEGNRWLPEWIENVERDFMERTSVRYADVVVSPSAYLLDWMRDHRWILPEKAEVIPNVMSANAAPQPSAPAAASRITVDRLIFFGRLEIRKGLKLFCDAIDRLPPSVLSRVQDVVFLGKAIAKSGGFDSRAFIGQRTGNWTVPVQILSDRNRDEALAELKRPGTLAVIASLVENSPYTVLECLTNGIAFVATRVGGIPEMLRPEDHATHLFDPNPQALASVLQNALEHGIQTATLAWDPDAPHEQWLRLFESLASDRAGAASVRVGECPAPMVSVCLVHYNRPHLLGRALDSLRRQTYSNFEVVLVDDGSPSEVAQQYLSTLQEEFDEKGWTIVRQPNSYLGAARNAAVKAARGDYLLFMDDDNVALPEMLQTFVHAAVCSGADVLTCPNMLFTGDQPREKVERIWLPLGGAGGVGVYRNAFGDANALWKRSAFERVGGYTTDYGVGHEDWELFADAVLAGLRLELVPVPLYWYRVNPQGMLRSGDHWADHARSVRPYLRHDPQGLGMALAYGLYLQRMREIGASAPAPTAAPRASRWRALWQLGRLAADGSLRARFYGAWRAQGLRVALRRAWAKAAQQ